MRRGRRERIEKNSNVKYLIYTLLGIALIMLLTFAISFVTYSNKVKDSSYSALTTEKIAELVPNDSIIEVQEASTDIGKTIEEVINSIEEKNNIEDKVEEKEEESKNINEEIKQEIVNTNTEPVKVKDPEFSIPVEGEITIGFAKDSLIYSETLEEWIVHLGVDIKAERTTVVKSAEERNSNFNKE